MKPREKGTFSIYRYYSEEGRPPTLKASGLTWDEAQKWVNDPTTSKAGKWFDGFTQTA